MHAKDDDRDTFEPAPAGVCDGFALGIGLSPVFATPSAGAGGGGGPVLPSDGLGFIILDDSGFIMTDDFGFILVS